VVAADPDGEGRPAMMRFAAIEGLRGWLAWTVVLCHLVVTSSLHARGFGPQLRTAGTYAVLVFIIISGFVITHLVTERPEPYGTYLLRRFMRIFPLFAVTCAIGLFVADIYADTLSRVPWAADPTFAWDLESITGTAHSIHEFFWSHLFAHLTMLHGVISSSVLPWSLYALNPPAWSLSLEWQFYIVAPFVVVMAGKSRAIIPLALTIAAIEIAFRFGAFGKYESPSFIGGVAGYFALGIASRLAYPALIGAIRRPYGVTAATLTLLPLAGWDAAPLLIWGLVMVGLSLNLSDPGTASFARAYRFVLESPTAAYFGSRSYSVYLGHWPVFVLCHALWLYMFPTAMHVSTFIGVSAMTIPGTLIFSELLYRGIERPGIALGSRMASRLHGYAPIFGTG
jgi:peptidoglycan/LPS O-acetylase OafA/YrhL